MTFVAIGTLRVRRLFKEEGNDKALFSTKEFNIIHAIDS